MGIDYIGEIARVNATIVAEGASVGDFGTALFLRHYTPITDPSASGWTLEAQSQGLEVEVYNSREAVATKFGANSEAAKAATAWYSQTPKPKDFAVASWCPSGLTGYIEGSPITLAYADFLSATSPTAIKVTVGGKQTANLNFAHSSVSSYTLMAAAIQAGIRAISGISKSTVVYDATAKSLQFILDPRDRLPVSSGIQFSDRKVAEALGFTDERGAKTSCRYSRW